MEHRRATREQASGADRAAEHRARTLVGVATLAVAVLVAGCANAVTGNAIRAQAPTAASTHDAGPDGAGTDGASAPAAGAGTNGFATPGASSDGSGRGSSYSISPTQPSEPSQAPPSGSAGSSGPSTGTLLDDLGQQGQPATEVKKVTPFTDDGELRLPINMDKYVKYQSRLDDASCGASSVSTAASVYQCGGGFLGTPACWRTDGLMLCMGGPDSDDLLLHRVSNPDPVPAHDDDAQPWQITLDDGATCIVRGGGAADRPPEGYDWTYWCDSDEDGTYRALVARDDETRYDTITRTSSPWTAQLATYSDVDDDGVALASFEQVDVRTVIYAGAAPDLPQPRSGPMCPTVEQLSAHLDDGFAIGDDSEITCVDDWANVNGLAAVDDDGNPMWGEVGLFHKTTDGWHHSNREQCDTGLGMPVAYLGLCFVG